MGSSSFQAQPIRQATAITPATAAAP
jgi:hypothetical protein